MDDFLKELAKQIPAIFALLLIVFAFLKYLNSRSEQAEKRDERLMNFISEQQERFQQLGNDYRTVQERATAIIDRNTIAMGRMEKVLDGAIEKIQVIGIDRRKVD